MEKTICFVSWKAKGLTGGGRAEAKMVLRYHFWRAKGRPVWKKPYVLYHARLERPEEVSGEVK